MSRTPESSGLAQSVDTIPATSVPRKVARHKRPPVREEERTPCPVCGRSFGRQEHMYRHLLIHQGQGEDAEQQHVCPACSKVYSRRDALLRHQQTHGPEVAEALAAASQSSPSVHRRAPSKSRKACERCSRMKIRCDGQRPCAKCAPKPALARHCSSQGENSGDAGAQITGQRRLVQEWRARRPDGYPLKRSEPHQTRQDADRHHHSDDDVGTAVRHRDRQRRSTPLPFNESALAQPSVPSSPSDPPSQARQTRVSTTTVASANSARQDRVASSHRFSPPPQADSQGLPSDLRTRRVGSSGLAERTTSAGPASPDLPFVPPGLHNPDEHITGTRSARYLAEPASVSFCDEVEMINADEAPSVSDLGLNAVTPSHHLPSQAGSRLHALDDLLAMSDLEWLFASPASMPSVGLEEMTDAFGLPDFGEQMVENSAQDPNIGSGPVWAPAAPILEPAGLYCPEPSESLLDLLAGTATLDLPDRRSQEISNPSVATMRATKEPSIMSHRSFAVTMHGQQRLEAPDSSQSLSDLPRSHSSRRQRRLEPQDLTAPSRRGSPTRQLYVAPASEPSGDGSDARQQIHEETHQPTQWPNSWYPESGRSQTRIDHLATNNLNAEPDIVAEESSCQVPPIDASSVLKLHALADYVASDGQDEQSVRTILKSINVETYNVMLQLYFEKFHRSYCFLHQPSFNPATAHPLLLAACCAVGCSFSQMKNSRLLAEYLCDTVHTAVNMSCMAENLHARSLSIIQALCLVGIFFGTSGNQRLLEHAEAQRSALATMVRRCHLLEYQAAPEITRGQHTATVSVHDQWQTWLRWEGIKRTAWICVVADLEFSAAWKIPSVYSLEELQSELPQSDRKWMAPTASLWKSYRAETSLTLPEAHDRLHSSVGTSSFHNHQQGATIFSEASLMTSKILSCTLQLYASSLRAFGQHALMSRAVEQPLDLLRDFLIRSSDLAASCHHPSEPGDEQINECLSSVSFEQMTHFLHLSLKVDLSDIQKLGGRKGSRQANDALLKVHTQRMENPKNAELLAASCGRIIHLARHYPAVSTYSINIVFYASLYLYAFSKSLRRMVTPSEPSESGSAVPVPVLCLDTPTARLQTIVDEQGSTSSSKKQYQLRFVGDLSGPLAPLRILKTYSTLLQSELNQRTPGASARIFGRVLADLAHAIERQQRLSEIQRGKIMQSGIGTSQEQRTAAT